MRYINYARRSSDEKSKKQVQSIEDQLKDTRRIAAERNLEVIEEMTESRTAKEPGRSVFNRMITKIERGEADAILCWKLDRLSRNPIDAGVLRWLMRKRKLLEIQTPYQIYRCDDNAVIAAVESAMAEQYIVDLEKGVERGMASKCEKGGYPMMAPSGYRNDRLTRSVEVDEERFALLRRAWGLLLTGQHTVPQIHDILVNQWGYRGRITKSNLTGQLTLSSLYNIFNNPFYMGAFTFRGTVYTHSFRRMVTKEEFEMGQSILNRRGAKKPTRHTFAYTGLMTCASCGYFITAEKAKGHTYYHCNNKLGVCSKKGVREEKIEERIEELLDSITLPAEFEALAREILEHLQHEEAKTQQQIASSQERIVANLKRQKDALLSLYLEGHLEAAEYASKKQELSQQEASLKLEEEQIQQRQDTTDEVIENVTRYATQAKSLFAAGTTDLKRSIATHLGTYIVNNGVLQIELNPLFAKVRSEWKNLENNFLKIEPSDFGSDKEESPPSGPLFQRWYASFDKYRTFVRENRFYLPKI